MTNRKKRLQKGIESLQGQIQEHEAKKQRALAEGKTELADYYRVEIEGIEKSKRNKEDKLD
jgi:phage shock protein A